MTETVHLYDPNTAYHVEYRHPSRIWPRCQHGYVSGGCAACQPVADDEELVAMAPASEEQL